MKTKTFACMAGLALASAAQAGTPAIETAPATSAGLWQWFIGGSAGYLTDLDEGMYGLQAGMEYRLPGERSSHAIYLEIGYTQRMTPATAMFPLRGPLAGSQPMPRSIWTSFRSP